MVWSKCLIGFRSSIECYWFDAFVIGKKLVYYLPRDRCPFLKNDFQTAFTLRTMRDSVGRGDILVWDLQLFDCKNVFKPAQQVFNPLPLSREDRSNPGVRQHFWSGLCCGRMAGISERWRRPDTRFGSCDHHPSYGLSFPIVILMPR